MKNGTLALGDASLHIGYSQVIEPSQRGFVREITEFFVPEPQRGKGQGTALLTDVCEQANQHKLMLIIIADNARLQSFYVRHDFITIQDEPVILMMRNPKEVSH